MNKKKTQELFIQEIFLQLEQPKYCRDMDLIKKTYPYSDNFNKLSYTQPFRVISIDAVKLILIILDYYKKNENLEKKSKFLKQLLLNIKLIGLVSSLTRSFLIPKTITFSKVNIKGDYILAICLKKCIVFGRDTIHPGFGILLGMQYLDLIQPLDNFILFHYQSETMSFL